MNWQQYELEHQQRLENARSHAANLPLEEIDVAHWDLMRFDTIWPYYERLRQESPVYLPRKKHRWTLLVRHQLRPGEGGGHGCGSILVGAVHRVFYTRAL